MREPQQVTSTRNKKHKRLPRQKGPWSGTELSRSPGPGDWGGGVGREGGNMYIRHKERGSHRVTPFMQTHQQGHTMTQMHAPTPPPPHTHANTQRRVTHKSRSQTQPHRYSACTNSETRSPPRPPQHTHSPTHIHTHTLIRPGQARVLLSHPQGSSALEGGAASPPQSGRGGACGRASPEPPVNPRGFSSPRPLDRGGASERREGERKPLCSH